MDRGELSAELARLAAPYHLDEWEMEEQVERLVFLPHATQRRVLDLVGSLWPVSHALTFLFLGSVGRGLEVLGDNRLQIWVGAVLDAYEEGGLEGAQPVLADGGRAFLAALNGEVGLRFQDVASRLLPYLCGLAEATLDIAVAERPGTDTAVVYLPRRISLFRDDRMNFLLYKLTAAFQWGYIRGGTYRAEVPAWEEPMAGLLGRYGGKSKGGRPWLRDFFDLFPDPVLAEGIFRAAEEVRVADIVGVELPGLLRDTRGIRRSILEVRPALAGLGGRPLFFECLRRKVLGDAGWKAPLATLGEAGDLAGRLFESPVGSEPSPRRSLEAVAALFEPLCGLSPGEETGDLPFTGALLVEEAAAARLRRREAARVEFVEAFASLLGAGVVKRLAEAADSPHRQRGEGAAAPPVSRGSGSAGGEDGPKFLVFGAERVAIPEEILPLVKEIRDDLGDVPASYLSGILSRAGGSGTNFTSPPGEEGIEAVEPLSYDEWDFRRAGFRKKWCLLHELDLDAAGVSFVRSARMKYRGQLRKIRRSFEMMRTSERFLKRQRDGEDLDIDAVVESLADLRAGRPASERLFIRLVRDRRDIAALFLVDMSSSTEGWVSTVIKESLVLLCESLETLGDRYAIYGFSGMKRLRSELFRIKTFAEHYGSEVQGRIAAIGPRDYTRMGPPIRHGTELLKKSDARVKLLVTLSDGKPEDYDDYRGEYAIEDTRHALIEAKASGVHPFCITVDREAQDYISHMYGEVNYVTIDDAHKLPVKVPEIYRVLTT